MRLTAKRKRGCPVFVGYEKILGADVKFALDRGRTLLFTAEQPMLAFGIMVVSEGSIRLRRGFQFHDVQARLRPPAGEARGPSAFGDGDRDRALETAIQKAVQVGAERLIQREAAAVSEAWLTLADDYVLERMAYIAHVEERLACLGKDAPWKEEQFCREQVERAEREAAGADEEAYATSWMHASRPGYVVICDGKPVDKGEERHREDRGTGWVQRHVFIHLEQARSFAGKVSGEDVRVERIRIIKGMPYSVVPDGFAAPGWSLEDPVLTGTLLAPGRG